jgi:alanine racemase
MWNWIELDGSALRHNVAELAKVVEPSKPCFVLKSNAYGHGFEEVFSVLKPLNLSMLAVNYVWEAQKLRSLGYKGRVIVVGPFVPSDMEMFLGADAEVFLGHEEGLEAWLRSKSKCKIHIEFDTGMSRQGFLPKLASTVAESVLKFREHIIGVCMHFANVEDVTDHSYADLQLSRFEATLKEFQSRGMRVETHAASSASSLIMTSSHFDFCRIGISLYGQWPSGATKISYANLQKSEEKTHRLLKPVLSWKTQITSINQVDKNQFIGYGCTYRARRNMIVGVLPVGYFEGYPRMASGSNAYVLINGGQCPIVGRICMNMMMVDMTDLSSPAKVGDEVTLIGRDGLEVISAGDVATWSETIHYELLTRINGQICRKIL